MAEQQGGETLNTSLITVTRGWSLSSTVYYYSCELIHKGKALTAFRILVSQALILLRKLCSTSV
jgi:hypothetical protein